MRTSFELNQSRMGKNRVFHMTQVMFEKWLILPETWTFLICANYFWAATIEKCQKLHFCNIELWSYEIRPNLLFLYKFVVIDSNSCHIDPVMSISSNSGYFKLNLSKKCQKFDNWVILYFILSFETRKNDQICGSYTFTLSWTQMYVGSIQ